MKYFHDKVKQKLVIHTPRTQTGGRTAVDSTSAST
jgi:hypothetical protein